VPSHDLQCPLLSLPHRFATTVESAPAEIPYLAASDCMAAKWSAQLERLAGLKVGLYWQGNPHHPWDRHRSIRLAALRQLSQVEGEGVSLVSLQQGPGREQLATLADILPLHDLGGEFTTIDDLAGAIAGLDFVISVDTAAAHLAGAMGKPVWVLLSAMSDWRWLLERLDSPWYPSMRLFRQRRLGDWDAVVAEVVHSLPSAQTRHGRRRPIES
jgi:hypothetical protein